MPENFKCASLRKIRVLFPSRTDAVYSVKNATVAVISVINSNIPVLGISSSLIYQIL